MKWILSIVLCLLGFATDSIAGPSKRHIKGQYGTAAALQIPRLPTATPTAIPEYVPYWADGISVGNLSNAANWQEISGNTNPQRSENYDKVWMQSDGSISVLLSASAETAASTGEWALTGVTGVDFEDLSSATVSGNYYIYLGDIGNNGNTADSRGAGVDVRIYRIKEPVITGSNGTIAAGDIENIAAAYPVVGAPSLRDAETLMTDPLTGDMYIITKRESAPGVYRLPHASSYTGTQTLEFVGTMYDIPDVSSPSASGNAVGGNFSPSGTEILIKSYNVMYLFTWDRANQTILQALQATPQTIDGYVGGGNTTYAKSHPSQEPQGEAVTFDTRGVNYFTASEYVTAHGSSATAYPLFKYNRLTKVPTTISFQQGVLPDATYAGNQDTYIWNTNGTTNYGTETTYVCDNPLGSDSRVGLERFDVSLIPSSATIVGVKLYLTLAAEGQGWFAYRIINSNWAESTVTWNNIPNGPPAVNNVFAVSTPEITNGVNLDTINGVTVQNNMSLATLQCWVNGTCNNHGWLIPGAHADDGVQFNSCRNASTATRPLLTVRYTQ